MHIISPHQLAELLIGIARAQAAIVHATGNEAGAVKGLQKLYGGPTLADLPVRDWEVERDERLVTRILGSLAPTGGILGEISLRTGPKLYSIGP